MPQPATYTLCPTHCEWDIEYRLRAEAHVPSFLSPYPDLLLCRSPCKYQEREYLRTDEILRLPLSDTLNHKAIHVAQTPLTGEGGNTTYSTSALC